GVGRSGQPPGPYTSGEMAADLKALVAGLGLPRFHLAGVSMGGAIAQEYAVAHPDDLLSLVLANTFAVADPFTAAAFETWATVAEAAGMPVMMRQQAPWIFSPGFYEQHPAPASAPGRSFLAATPPSGKTRGHGTRPSSTSSATTARRDQLEHRKVGYVARGEIRHRQARDRDGALSRLAGTAAARPRRRAK